MTRYTAAGMAAAGTGVTVKSFLHPLPKVGGKERVCELGFWNLKAYPSDTPPPTEPLPNPYQTVLPAGDQASGATFIQSRTESEGRQRIS